VGAGLLFIRNRFVFSGFLGGVQGGVYRLPFARGVYRGFIYDSSEIRRRVSLGIPVQSLFSVDRRRNESSLVP